MDVAVVKTMTKTTKRLMADRMPPLCGQGESASMV